MRDNIKVNYYDTFKCIAGDCPLTCCQEWRIGVDDHTLQKWQGVNLKANNQDGENKLGVHLCSHVKSDESGHVITLNKEKKCPFLNQDKLCRLVTELGEDYLSETCTTFPRQINTFENRTEYSLDTGCPAVVDLLNQNLNTIHFHREGAENPDLVYTVREMILTLIQDENYTLTERMMIIFYALLELFEQDEITAKRVNQYTDGGHIQPLVQAIRKMRFNSLDSFWEGNELFLDVVHNYRKQKLYVDYLEPISVRAEGLEKAYTDKVILEKAKNFEKVLLPYEGLLKNYLISEIFGNCLMPEMELEDVVVGFQWITLEYAVLKQAIFLKWLMNGEGEIDYTMVRDYISVISRVTGYEQSDIREYLENSFEEVIWEWGYLALVLGNGKL